MKDNSQEEEPCLPSSRLRGKQGISNFQAGVSLAKAIMGAGSFALPWAFSKMGYLVGPLSLMILMCLSIYSLSVLVGCSQGKSSYVDVARGIFGQKGAQLAYAASLSASIGVCGSYLVFMAATLHSLVPHLSQNSFLLLLVPIVILLSSVRDVQRFAFASLLGDISVVLGMVVVLIYGVGYHEGNNDESAKRVMAVGSFGDMPLGFGNIGYLFLVHFLALPIESSMRRPDQFISVASVTFSMCALIGGGFGLIGYLTFGEKTEQIILLNVEGSFFLTAVKLLLCIDLICTYPLVMRPSIMIVQQTIITSCESGNGAVNKSKGLGSYQQHLMVCILLGILASAGATLLPAFGLLSGLVGGVSQTFLGFVLPPLLSMKVQRAMEASGSGEAEIKDYNFSALGSKAKQTALVGLGVALILWTILTSIKGTNAH